VTDLAVQAACQLPNIKPFSADRSSSNSELHYCQQQSCAYRYMADAGDVPGPWTL